MSEHASAVPESSIGSSVALSMLGVNMMVLMATLDMSIVNVSLPTLAASLGVDFATIQWVILSYVVAIACLLLLISRLGDMMGKKRIFASGLVIFTIASLLCGLAPSAHWLIAFRAVQGVGAAMSQALGIAIVTEIAPPGTRGRAIGFVGATVSMGLALGPSVGGILIDLAGWRWIFLVNVPIGLLAMRIVAKYMPALPPSQARQRFDVPGAVIAAVTLGCYCLGMTMGQKTGFDQTGALALLGLSLVGFAGFLAVERRTAQPMIDLSLFRNLRFSLNLLMSVLVFISLSGGFIVPFFLQMAQGRATWEVGLIMMVLPVCMGVFAMLSGSLSDRFGSRGLSILGLATVCVGYLAMTGLTQDAPWWEFVLRNCPVGIGIGLFQVPNNSAIMGAVPRERLGVASGLLNYTRVFGQSTGMPLVGAIFTASIVGMSAMPTRADMTHVPPGQLVVAFCHTNAVLFFLAMAALILGVIVWRLDRTAGANAAV
ncbi:MAG: DHA2 family efflux MFS transporter permease subunit [Desulfovibrionaceae bacterium]|nr:DHA2 family efflux MFS transporter permease subunit [Desulfovibrionaceae bacterium]